MAKIGVISDTHGLLREGVKSIFKGCDLIVHAGDIGRREIIGELERLQKVIAVKGNVDPMGLLPGLKEIERIEFEGIRILLIHNLNDLPRAGNLESDVIIYGHSHKAEIKKTGNTLYFNPGSAGPKRFRLPVTLGFLNINGKSIDAEIISLEG